MATLLNPLRSRKVRLAVKTDRTEHLVDLIPMVKEGKIESQIHQMLSLDHAQAAHAYVEKRHRKGAVVLLVDRS